MIDLPAFGGRQPDTKASVEAGAKAGAESPTKQATGELVRVFTEAFGPQTNPLDVSVVSQKNGYRVIVNQALVPAKEQMKIFGFPLPFQRRERGAVPTALANLNVSAKRQIFRKKLFKYKGSQRMYFKDLKDARALTEFVAYCKEKLGNPEPAAKSDADTKTKREAAVKSAPPASPLVGVPGMGAGAPPGLAGIGGAPPGMPSGLPGMPGGLPGMPGGAPGGGLPPGLMAGLGGGRPPGGPRMPGGMPGMPGNDDGMPV